MVSVGVGIAGGVTWAGEADAGVPAGAPGVELVDAFAAGAGGLRQAAPDMSMPEINVSERSLGKEPQ